MNPDEKILYPKNQYKKYIKDVVSGTLERTELIEETIIKHLDKDIDLKKTDKLLKIILFSAVFELLFKHNIYPRRYFNPTLNKIKVISSDEKCPISESISRRILCLPSHDNLTIEDVLFISSIIKNV